VSLVREVYAYEGGGRDPFMSLLKSGDVRPLISDLKLTTVVYDGRFASRSVAVLRDITNRRIYRVKTGDIIGRLKVDADPAPRGRIHRAGIRVRAAGNSVAHQAGGDAMKAILPLAALLVAVAPGPLRDDGSTGGTHATAKSAGSVCCRRRARSRSSSTCKAPR